MVVKIVAGGHRHPLATPRIGGQYSFQRNYAREDYIREYIMQVMI